MTSPPTTKRSAATQPGSSGLPTLPDPKPPDPRTAAAVIFVLCAVWVAPIPFIVLGSTRPLVALAISAAAGACATLLLVLISDPHQTARTLARHALIGPTTGTLATLLLTGTAVAAWVSWGTPDFYFRDWAGVRLAATTSALLGYAVGSVFTGVILLFERAFGREVRAVAFCFTMVAASTVVGATLAILHFAAPIPAYAWPAELALLLIASLLAVAKSRRAT